MTERAVPFPMKEVREPKFVEFKSDGQIAEGVLIGIDRPEVGNPPKNVARFVLSEVDFDGDRVIPTGDRLCFLGTADLVQKIQRNHLGHYLRVRYEGEDQNVRRNGNAMRRFKVLISEAPAFSIRAKESEADSTFITDADIPF